MAEGGARSGAGGAGLGLRWGISEKPTFTVTGCYGAITTFGGTAFHSPLFRDVGVIVLVLSVVGYVAATWVALLAILVIGLLLPLTLVSVILQLSFGSLDQKPSFLQESALVVPVGNCATPKEVPGTFFGHYEKPLSGSDPSAIGFEISAPDFPTAIRERCFQVAHRRFELIPWVILVPIAVFGVLLATINALARRVLPEFDERLVQNKQNHQNPGKP